MRIFQRPCAAFDAVSNVSTVRRTARPKARAHRRIRIFDVEITDIDMREALELVTEMIAGRTERARSIYFVNAHTLNVAAADQAYRDVLNAGDYVFGDGTGVRWAARLQGVRLCDNVNGTDLVPALLSTTGGRARRYFLLGADPLSIEMAAQHATLAYSGWSLAGYHHGFLTSDALTANAIRQINQSRPDLLLVGMGNPLQETWIHAHRDELEVPVCMGVGGIFQYWAGTLRRAPRWLRRTGFEWLGILCQQPHKIRRYFVGNPLFLARSLRDAWRRGRLPEPS